MQNCLCEKLHLFCSLSWLACPGLNFHSDGEKQDCSPKLSWLQQTELILPTHRKDLIRGHCLNFPRIRIVFVKQWQQHSVRKMESKQAHHLDTCLYLCWRSWHVCSSQGGWGGTKPCCQVSSSRQKSIFPAEFFEYYQESNNTDIISLNEKKVERGRNERIKTQFKVT